MDRFILAVASSVQWLFSWLPFYGKEDKVYWSSLSQRIDPSLVRVNVVDDKAVVRLEFVLDGNKSYHAEVTFPVPVPVKVEHGRFPTMADVPTKKDIKPGDYVKVLRNRVNAVKVNDRTKPIEAGEIVRVDRLNLFMDGINYKVGDPQIDNYLPFADVEKVEEPAPFNVGDDVVCIKGPDGWLTEGIKPFKVGDKVRIISKRPENTGDFPGWMASMDATCGMVGEIRSVGLSILVSTSAYAYRSEWLEHFTE